MIRRNKNSNLKLQKVESCDADISGMNDPSSHKDGKSFFNDDDEFFKILEKPRKKSIKKSFKRVSKKRISQKNERVSFKKKADKILKKYQFKPQLKLDSADENQRIIVDNIKQKMDLYNDHYTAQINAGLIKGGPIQPNKDSVLKHKFNIHKNYTDSAQFVDLTKQPIQSSYNYESVIRQLNGTNPNIYNLENHSLIQGMPYPQHFVESLKMENELLRDM